jgi:hypothetical protein
MVKKLMAHACNPSYLGGGDRRIVVGDQPDKKSEPLSGK